MRPMRSVPPAGFTLIEVMVSVALLGFAIVVILASLGHSGHLAATDARKALAGELLQRCFIELDPATNPGGGNSPTLGLAPIAWDSSPAKRSLWFNAGGSPVAAEQEAFFECDLTPNKETGSPLGHLHGRIAWPARRGTAKPDGEVELFTSFMLP